MTPKTDAVYLLHVTRVQRDLSRGHFDWQEFGRGSGADCRRHVQTLNAMRGAMMEEEHCTWASQ